ncbi:MAG: serine/threonine protein kinase [Trueperaceae bacterium]|nr:serine/threonine protein kinase [Trueperaceae bacterium]
MSEPAYVPDGYEIVQRLGAGQTSVVWLARHARSDRRVALKLPRNDVRTNPVLRRMFENEVQITLKLDHRNVVRAFDGHPTGVHAYLALEYCQGGTLDQLLLEKGRLPMVRALGLVDDVALGLAHTHEQQVLHRDVKPANVFLDDEGTAKLGDFGTGTFAADASDERVGTAFYMAPEIFQGSSPTAQSDVYSLGVLAYEVLSGERPFVGSSYDGLMIAHLTSLPRDLRHLRSDLPNGLSAVVTRAMSRDATRRFQSVEAFVKAYRTKSGTGDQVSSGGSKVPVEPEAATGRAGRVGAATPAPVNGRSADRTPETPEGERRGLFGWLRRRKR